MVVSRRRIAVIALRKEHHRLVVGRSSSVECTRILLHVGVHGCIWVDGHIGVFAAHRVVRDRRLIYRKAIRAYICRRLSPRTCAPPGPVTLAAWKPFGPRTISNSTCTSRKSQLEYTLSCADAHLFSLCKRAEAGFGGDGGVVDEDCGKAGSAKQHYQASLCSLPSSLPSSSGMFGRTKPKPCLKYAL